MQAMGLRPGVPPGRPWEPVFAHDLVHWAAVLRWQEGPADVTWVELALDCELFLEQAVAPPLTAVYRRPVQGEGAIAATSVAAVVAPHGGGTALAGGPQQPLPGAHPAWGPHVCGATGAASFHRQGGHGAATTRFGTTPEGGLAGPAFCAGWHIAGGGRRASSWPIFPAPRTAGPLCYPMPAGRSKPAPRVCLGHRSNSQGSKGLGEGSVRARCEQHHSPSPLPSGATPGLQEVFGSI